METFSPPSPFSSLLLPLSIFYLVCHVFAHPVMYLLILSFFAHPVTCSQVRDLEDSQIKREHSTLSDKPQEVITDNADRDNTIASVVSDKLSEVRISQTDRIYNIFTMTRMFLQTQFCSSSAHLVILWLNFARRLDFFPWNWKFLIGHQ